MSSSESDDGRSGGALSLSTWSSWADLASALKDEKKAKRNALTAASDATIAFTGRQPLFLMAKEIGALQQAALQVCVFTSVVGSSLVYNFISHLHSPFTSTIFANLFNMHLLGQLILNQRPRLGWHPNVLFQDEPQQMHGKLCSFILNRSQNGQAG